MANRSPHCKHERYESHVYREGLKRHTYLRCIDCAAEKTVTEAMDDLTDTVTVDEIIEVHLQLNSGKPFGELIPKEKT